MQKEMTLSRLNLSNLYITIFSFGARKSFQKHSIPFYRTFFRKKLYFVFFGKKRPFICKLFCPSTFNPFQQKKSTHFFNPNPSKSNQFTERQQSKISPVSILFNAFFHEEEKENQKRFIFNLANNTFPFEVLNVKVNIVI